MARWEGDREVTHVRVCACTLACMHCGMGGARLRGGWRAKTTTTWLDGAAALECSGGEATGRQDGRDGMAASVLGGVGVRWHRRRARQRHTAEERREEADEWARCYLKFKPNPNQLTFYSIQPLASKLDKNPRKFVVTD
jgi:hypothetical protein